MLNCQVVLKEVKPRKVLAKVSLKQETELKYQWGKNKLELILEETEAKPLEVHPSLIPANSTVYANSQPRAME